MFKNPFSFEGRIRRLEYGLSYIIYMLGQLSISYAMEANEANPWFLLLYIPLLWFLFAQGAKRCHDRGNNGGWQVIPFYVFWLIFADGVFGENEYGKNPKGLGNTDDLEDFGTNLIS